jgi:hypothetical protein
MFPYFATAQKKTRAIVILLGKITMALFHFLTRGHSPERILYVPGFAQLTEMGSSHFVRIEGFARVRGLDSPSSKCDLGRADPQHFW